ncbi:hypothetical protein BDZ97DRAFT_324329 [Flammula alnicola]|nr:hypothetical protein BDZ97DRAFT_324329 [Flammula alnicola]
MSAVRQWRGACNCRTVAPSLYSDHLNSVTLLDGNRPHPFQLASNPARSLYRWIFHTRDAAQRTGLPTDSHPQPSQTPLPFPYLQHVHAHTSSTSFPSSLNSLADDLASHRSSWKSLPPAAPSPTFFMDDHTPYTEQHGFIEQNLFSFVDTCLAKAQTKQVPSLSSSILLPCLE